jgi:hypothetical protein
VGIIVKADRGDKNMETLIRFSPTHAGIKRTNSQMSVAQIGFIESLTIHRKLSVTKLLADERLEAGELLTNLVSTAV